VVQWTFKVCGCAAVQINRMCARSTVPLFFLLILFALSFSTSSLEARDDSDIELRTSEDLIVPFLTLEWILTTEIYTHIVNDELETVESDCLENQARM